jgi:YD repeat-containing protein
MGGLFALARFLAERTKRSWNGVMAPSRAGQGGVCLRPKKNVLNVLQLEQRNPPSDPLGGYGVPVLSGALLVIGYQFDPVCAQDNSVGYESYSTVPALTRSDATQQDDSFYEADQPLLFVEPQFHVGASGAYTPDDDSTWRPTDGAPSTVTDPLMDSLADQRDPDDPSGTVPSRDLGGGGASGGFPTAPMSTGQAGQMAGFPGNPSAATLPIGPASHAAATSTTTASAPATQAADTQIAASSATTGSTSVASTTTAAPKTQVTVQPPANTGIAFTQNVGQTSSQAQFVASGSGYSFFLTGGGLVTELTKPNASAQTDNAGGPDATTSVVSMQLVGANANPAVQGEDERTSTANYFIGQNAYTNVPQYSKVLYSDVYPNIGVQYYSNGQGQLEYDMILGVGADLSQIKLSFTGANSVSIDSSGDLVLNTGAGNIIEEAPTFYQLDAQGNKVDVPGQYELNPDGTVGFTAAFNPAETLFIDPVLNVWQVTSSADTGATAIAIDPVGNLYMTGWTDSTAFPPTTGSYQTTYGGGSEDAFVSKFTLTNTSGYTTYLGGSGQDIGWGIAFDSAGDAYVTGATSSSNFVTTTGALASYHSSATSDTFVVKLDPTGSALLYSTVLDGTASANADLPAGLGGINGGGIAVDAYGNTYVTGTTSDYAHFPHTTTIGTPAGQSAFVVELNASGSALDFSALIGDDDTSGTSIAVDSSYNIYATGDTNTSVSGLTATGYNGGGAGEQGYVIKFSPAYSEDYLALLGNNPASAGDGQAHEHANAIAVNGSGNAFVAGDGTDTMSHYTDYALELTANGSTLVYDKKIIVSGTSAGTATGISVDTDGNAWVTGYDSSGAMTLVNDFASYAATATVDGYLAEVDNSTHNIDFASYFGGLDDEATAIAQNPLGAFPLGEIAVAGVYYEGVLSGDVAETLDIGGISGGVTPPGITNVYSQSGHHSVGHLSKYQTLEIDGSAPNGSTVTLYRDGVQINSSPISVSSGAWDFDDPDTLAQGNYIYTATDTAGGVTSDLSGAYNVMVELSAPAITITMASNVTSESPVVEVTASDLVGISPSAEMKLYVDGSFATEGELVNGNVDLQLAGLSLGNHTLVAEITNLAGIQGATTVSFDVVTHTTWGLSDATRQFDTLGTNIVSHALDLDTSPGTGQSLNAALVYNSADISPEPTILADLQTANSAALPATMDVDLYWDNVSQGTVSYDLVDNYAPGDQVPISAQVTSPQATGLYTYTLDVTFPGSSVTVTPISGAAIVVSENSSPFGAGWSFSPLNQLFTISTTSSFDPYGGILRVFGNGTGSFYQETVTGTYDSPAGDFGTLSAISGGSGGYDYVAPDGEKTVFNSSGLETGWTSADGFESIAAGYSSGKLSTFTAIDSTPTTIGYSSGVVTIVTDSRTVTLTLSSGDLTQITDPDSRVESYTYSSDLMTEDQLGDNANPDDNIYTSWAYTNGLLSSETLGEPATADAETTTIQPFGAAPFGAAPAGTQWGNTTDPDGNETWYLYDSLGGLVQQISPDGGIQTWDRDSNDLVTAYTDALGNETTFAYDGYGYMKGETLPDSLGTVTNTYENATNASTTLNMHLLESSVSVLGAETDYSYDSYGHVTSIVQAAGEGYAITTTYVYNDSSNGLLSAVYNSDNHLTTTYAYDGTRRETGETDYTSTGVDTQQTFTYDSNGNVASYTDNDGNTTSYTNDAMGRVTSQVLAGVTQTWEYNSDALVSQHIDGNGNAEYFYYNSRGDLTEDYQGYGSAAVDIALYQYNGDDEVTASRDGDGNWTDYAYDGDGDLISQTNALGDKQLFDFNLNDQLVAGRDANGNWSTETLNALGFVTALTNGNGDTTTLTVDAVGDVTSQEDPDTNVTTYSYDVLGRLTGTEDALTNTTTITYNDDGEVATSVDQNDIITSYVCRAKLWSHLLPN